MIPILYDASETEFTSNGLGRLTDCISCKVTEERNGIYECEFQYPVSGKWYDRLISGGIVGIWHDDRHDLQPFDIYKWSAPLDGIVTFNAHHISYRLRNIILRPFTASTVAELFTKIPSQAANPCPFTFWTDKTVSADWELNRPENVRAVLSGQSGSVLDVFGKAEYEFDRFSVNCYVNRGSNKGVTIRFGKNLANLVSTADAGGIYNAIAPFWAGTSEDGEEVVYLPEVFVKSPDVTGAAIPMVMDFSSEFQEKPTEAQLRQRALDHLSANEPWKAVSNITVDFMQLWQTPEYEDVAALQRVSLCDKVGIFYPKLGIVNEEAEITKVVYNVLLERFDSMEIGTLNATLADTIAGSMQERIDALAQLVNGKVNESFMQAAIENATSLITGGLGGYVVFGFNASGKPEEILIMDTDDVQTAMNVIRINRNGIGFSQGNGYEGPYTTAWTVDGAFVADFITSGSLNANVIKAGIIADAAGSNYWNMTTGEFRLASTAYVGTGTTTLADAAKETVIQYARNQSKTTAPASGWSTTVPAWADGYYIWQRTRKTTMTGSYKCSTPVLTAATTLSDTLTQQEIFNRLTNNGETQGIYLQNGLLYINAAYLVTGTISDAAGWNSWNLTTGDFSTTKGSIGSFTIQNGALTSGSVEPRYTGLSLQSTGFVIAQGSHKAELKNAALSFISIGDSEGHSWVTDFVLRNQYGVFFLDSPHYSGSAPGGCPVVYEPSYGGAYYQGIALGDNTSVYGNFTCHNGTKNRVADADEFGDRLLYCYETASPMFGDIGEGVIGEDGLCYVFLDPVFSETISSGSYQVFLQAYGDGGCFVSERKPGFFIVQGDPGMAFGWEVKAKQKDFDQYRLEKDNTEYRPANRNYGSEAAEYLNSVNEGRM